MRLWDPDASIRATLVASNGFRAFQSHNRCQEYVLVPIPRMSDQKPYFAIFADGVGTLVFHATTFLAASRKLHSPDFLAPRFVLKAHALELALKAFILAARLQSISLSDHRAPEHFQRLKEYGEKFDAATRDLASRNFGHNLQSLWREARLLDYESLDDLPAWLDMLSTLQTSQYELRYPKPATVYELPTLNQETAIEIEIDRLLDQASTRNRATP